MTDADALSPGTLAPGDAYLISAVFGRDEVTAVRHAVAACARTAGLIGDRLDDFVLVVNELITNAVRHGGGRGRLRLWSEANAVRCEVTDEGSGIAAARLGQQGRPEPGSVGGWGLWLVRRLCDDVMVSTGPTGTTVRISTRLVAAGTPGQHRSDSH
ncbi:ATP-binding protein [Micromonosporaceae bacterium DT194]|uniref:ATP-binding protein n=1 Tax=Melissospora conviva TaxID=3388432 RepID=UPI003C1EF5EA